MLYVFHTYRKLIWSMPNIVFYIEIDYLSIDESKLLNSNEDKSKPQGLCSQEIMGLGEKTQKSRIGRF